MRVHIIIEGYLPYRPPSKLCRAPAPTSELPSAMPVLAKMAFRSKEVMRLFLALDSQGCTTPLGMFPMLLKETAAVLAPKLTPDPDQ